MDKNPFSDLSFDSAQHRTGRLPVPTRNKQDEDLDSNASAGESGSAKRFGVRTCSASQSKYDQSRIPGQGIAGRAGNNTREHFPRSSLEPSTPRPQMRSRPETRPALDEASWTHFYDIYKKYSPIFVANKFSADRVKNALMNALKEKRVSLETVKGMGDSATLTEVQKKAIGETTIQCYLLKPENLSSKVSEPLVTKYEQTRAATRVAGRDSALVSQPDSFKPDDVWLDLQGDDLTTSLRRDIYLGRAGGSNNDRKPVDSSRSARPRQALNTAAKNDATPVRQANLQRTSALTSTFALTADASKTESTGSSSVSGAAGSFLQENQRLPETYSSRYVLESVILAHGNPETMRKPRQQATQHITTDSSNSRLPPPPLRKQEASLISPGSLFTPLSPAHGIRPEFPINTHAGTAVNPTLAANTRERFPVPRQKAPELAGARPKHPQYTSSPFVASARQLVASAGQRDARERDQAQDIQKLMRLLADIDISEPTIHELVKRDYKKKNAHELYNTLHYELDLSSETSSQVVESVKPQGLKAWRGYRQKYYKERINKVVPKYSAEELKKQKEREIMFNARKISDPQVEILAVGSHMSDDSGSTFDVRRTAFADFGENTDLSGDIHVTVNDIPEGKRFKEIHFTLLPGTVFDNKDASITLLKKVNKVMHKDGVLILSFGTGAKFNYDYKFLFENVLKPAGFVDCIDITTDDFFGVQMLVFKNEDRNARLLPPQPAWIGDVAWPAPVSPARIEAAPARSTGTLSQPVTQTILEPDSVHFGNATEEQVSKIVRNLKLLGSAIDEATCSGIKESINSIGLDEATIEHAAGDSWKQETKVALDRIQMQYTIQKLSPPLTPSVGSGLASGFEYNTDRPADYTPGTVFKPIIPAPAVVQKKRMGSPAAHNLTEVNTTASRQAPDKKDALMFARQKVDIKDQARRAESSPIKTASIVASAHADLRPAKAAASQTPETVSGNQPLQTIWSPRKEQLIHIMQSNHTSFDDDLVKEVLQNPRRPEFDLSADEFANLKVRYEEWRKNEKYLGLPVPGEIENYYSRVQVEKQLFEANFEDPSASIHTPTAAGASARAFSPVIPPRTESVNFPQRPFRANDGQIELSDGSAFNAFVSSGLPDRKPAQPESVSSNVEMADGNTRPSPRVRIPAQDFVRREENTATDDEVKDIIKALEKEYGRLDGEAISNIKKNIRFIKLSQVEIDNAAAGGRTLLDRILLECQILESSTPPRASSPKTEQSPVTSTDFGDSVQAEDVIDGTGNAARPLQHAGLQSSFYQGLLSTASNNYEPVYAPDQFRPQAPYPGSQQLQKREKTVDAIGQWLGMGAVSESLRLDLARASEQGQIKLSELVSPNNQNSALLGSNGVTPAQANLILAGLKKEDPNLSDSNIEMIRRHVGFIQLNQEQIDNAIRGGRDSLGDILFKCQMRETEVVAVEPDFSLLASGKTQPSVLADISDAGKYPTKGITHSHGNVALRVRAGIQARNNNCGLASFFMSLSHNGLLDKLIEDAENKVERLRASRDLDRAKSLTELVSTLKKFNVDGDLGKYIPNDELDNIRLRYGLRAAKLNHNAVVDALTKNGQVVNFEVESVFNRGADLNAETRKAAISLRMSEAPVQGSSYAMVVSLPDPSLGYMRLRGIDLAIGQRLAQTDLSGLEFVPLGEILEPVEFIPPILDEIYGYVNTEAGPLQSLSQLQSSTMSLKQKVSMVEVQNDRKTLNSNSKASVNFDHTIKDEIIPEDWILNESETVKEPHAYLRHLTGKVTEHYYKDGILRLKLTKELHHRDQSETRKVFDFLDQHGDIFRKTVVEMETHFLNGTPFIRARESEFVSPQSGKTMRVEQRMFGYGEEYPMSGEIKVNIMQRAGDFEELIDIFINSWGARFQGNVEGARRALLPDEDNSPEVIFMTIPNEGKDNRCKFDWQKDVGVPMYGSDQRVPYEVSAVMAIEGSHYLSWRRDPENGLIHFADSMGDIDDHRVTIPVVVTMPDQDTDAALQAANQNISGASNYYKEAKNRLKALGSQVALVMLKRKQ